MVTTIMTVIIIVVIIVIFNDTIIEIATVINMATTTITVIESVMVNSDIVEPLNLYFREFITILSWVMMMYIGQLYCFILYCITVLFCSDSVLLWSNQLLLLFLDDLLTRIIYCNDPPEPAQVLLKI